MTDEQTVVALYHNTGMCLFSGKEYELVTEKLSWMDAQLKCLTLDNKKRLATVFNSIEQKELAKFVQGER